MVGSQFDLLFRFLIIGPKCILSVIWIWLQWGQAESFKRRLRGSGLLSLRIPIIPKIRLSQTGSYRILPSAQMISFTEKFEKKDFYPNPALTLVIAMIRKFSFYKLYFSVIYYYSAILFVLHIKIIALKLNPFCSIIRRQIDLDSKINITLKWFLTMFLRKNVFF